MSTHTTRRSNENKKRKHGSNADGALDATSHAYAAEEQAPGKNAEGGSCRSSRRISELEQENAALKAQLQAQQKRIDELLSSQCGVSGAANFSVAGISGRPPAQHVLPRITEDMDVSDLRREAWERGWAAPDNATKAELLARIGIGSISLASVKNLMDLERKASNKELPIEHVAADIFAENGLKFLHLEERFYSLAYVSKDMHSHCVSQFEAEFRPRLPALVESIERSPCSSAKRFTFGRAMRFMQTPETPIILSWPSLQQSDLEEIDVLIQIEDCRKMHQDRGSKNFGYAVSRLHYDPATRHLFSNARCDHFTFESPFYKAQEGYEIDFDDSESDHKKALVHACARKPCLHCENCISPRRQSLPCLRHISTLAARVTFRHRNSGKMAQIVLDTEPHAWGEYDSSEPIGSYGITFRTSLDFASFGTVTADLSFRMFSEQRKDTDSFVFCTRPFPNSPGNDPQTELPSYCEMERSDKFSRLAFSMWTQEREQDISSSDDDSSDSSDDENQPRTKCLLQALRNYFWG